MALTFDRSPQMSGGEKTGVAVSVIVLIAFAVGGTLLWQDYLTSGKKESVHEEQIERERGCKLICLRMLMHVM